MVQARIRCGDIVYSQKGERTGIHEGSKKDEDGGKRGKRKGREEVRQMGGKGRKKVVTL